MTDLGVQRELGGITKELEWIRRELVRQDAVQGSRHAENKQINADQLERIEKVEQTVERYKGAFAILSGVATAGGLIGAGLTTLARKIGW